MVKHKTFEWHYLDVHQSNGYDFVFTFHTIPFMSRFSVSIFDVFVYRDNQPYFHEYFVMPRKEVKTMPGEFFYYGSGGRRFVFKTSERQVVLRVSAEKFTLHLTAENLQPNLEPLHYDLFEDSEEKSFKWHLYMPRARARGTLTIISPKTTENEELTIEGTTYYDGNSGNVNLQEVIDNWLWLKLNLRESFWILGKIVTNQQKTFDVAVKVDEHEICTTKKARIEFSQNRLQVLSECGNLDLQIFQTFTIDQLRFLVPSWSGVAGVLEKFREIFAAMALKRNPQGKISKMLTNGRYVRKRWLANDARENKVELFGEEMWLND